jgi:hypothetical protein
MYGRLYRCDALLERLPQDLQDIAAALGQFIQEEHTVVRQRHVARHRHVAPADQPRIRDSVMAGAKGVRRDERGAVAREASDATEVGGVDRCGQAR